MKLRIAPKIITAFMYIPRARYFLFNIDLRNRLGDIAAVSQILSEAKIEILSGTFVRGMGGKPGTWQVFVQPLNPETTVDDAKRLLLSCPDVMTATSKRAVMDYLWTRKLFP